MKTKRQIKAVSVSDMMLDGIWGHVSPTGLLDNVKRSIRFITDKERLKLVDNEPGLQSEPFGPQSCAGHREVHGEAPPLTPILLLYCSDHRTAASSTVPSTS